MIHTYYDIWFYLVSWIHDPTIELKYAIKHNDGECDNYLLDVFDNIQPIDIINISVK